MITKALATVCTLGLACVSPVFGDVVLGSTEIEFDASTLGVFDTVPMSFGMQANIVIPLLFVEGQVIGSGDIGTMWVSDPTTTGLIREQWQDGDSIDVIGVGGLVGGFSAFVGAGESNFPARGLDLALIATQTDEIRVTLLSFSTEEIVPFPGAVGTRVQSAFLFEFVSVPVPSGLALIGLGGFAGTRRRRC